MPKISRTILVTEATGGIGLAVCKRLAKADVSLVLAARNSGKLQALCAELSSTFPGTYSWISVDMTRDDSISEFAEELAATRRVFERHRIHLARARARLVTRLVGRLQSSSTTWLAGSPDPSEFARRGQDRSPRNCEILITN